MEFFLTKRRSMSVAVEKEALIFSLRDPVSSSEITNKPAGLIAPAVSTNVQAENALERV